MALLQVEAMSADLQKAGGKLLPGCTGPAVLVLWNLNAAPSACKWEQKAAALQGILQGRPADSVAVIVQRKGEAKRGAG